MNYETGIEIDEGNPLLEGTEEESRSRRNLILMALGVLVAIIAIAYFVNRSGGAADGADAKKQQAPVVTVITPGRTTVEGTITATGTLAARRELPVGRRRARGARSFLSWWSPANGSVQGRFSL